MNLTTWMTRTLPSLALRNKLITGLTTGFVTLFIGLASPAFADLTLTLGPETTRVVQPTTGTTTSITLTAYLGASGVGVDSESVTVYSVPIELSPPVGTGLPVGMTLTGATARTDFPDRAFRGEALVDPSSKGDYLVSVLDLVGGAPPVVFGTTSTALFDFTISIDSSVALGDYFATIVDESGLFGFAPNPTGGVHIGAPAVIRVVAVPEPSTLGILSLLVAPTVLRRRRRRRRRSI